MWLALQNVIHELYLGRIDARDFRLQCWGGRALGRGRRCRAGRRGRQGRRRWRWAAEGYWWRERQRTSLFPERRGQPILAWGPCKLSHVVVVLMTCQNAESIKSLHGLSQATAARQQHSTAQHCTALHCTALHCTALHCTAMNCS